MKTRLLKCLVGASLLFTMGSSYAQTTVSITAAGDSSWNQGNCPTPAIVDFYAYGSATGYLATDSIDVQYFFGDGASATERVPIWTNSYYSWMQHTYTAPGLYTYMAIATGPDGKADTLVRTPGVAVTDTCGNINGKLYIDNNSNCVFDQGTDSVLKYFPLTLSQSGSILHYGWSDANGDYVFSAPSGFQYSLSIVNTVSAGYIYACPSSGILTFTATSNSTNDLALQCNTTGFDLETTISGWRFRPRMNSTVWVHASNFSCNPTNATLTVTLDPKLTYVSSTIAPSNVTGNVITWNLNSFSHSYSYWNGNGFYSQLTVLTDSTANIGDSLCVASSITPTTGDLNINNNTSTYCGEVSNSYDPNEKEVSPKGLGINGNVAPNADFTYTIHFQNTGNDVAYNVAITDAIDNDLDVNSLRVISSSHSMQTRLLTGNVMKFSFENIMLADSGSNMLGSMGYVTYKVKAKTGLANGTQINNTANIYFDYNAAIVTNTTLNTISMALGVKEEKTENVYHVFPNPANAELNINFGKNFNGSVSIVDMLGKEVMVKTVDGQLNTTINTSTLEKGVYFIRINNEMNTAQRVIVIH